MKNINFFTARTKLMFTWLIMGTILTVFFVTQLSATIFDDIHAEAYGWFIPNLFPILMVVTSGFFSDFKKNDSVKIEVPRSYFSVAVYLSVAYMLLFAFIMFAYTRDKSSIINKKTIIDYYNNWNILLGAVQTLAIAAITAFFGKKKHSKDAE
jgi:hypothetical protein